MKNFILKNIYLILFILLQLTFKNTFAHDNNNNSFLFNGESSQLYVYDGQPANSYANQDGFKFFNSNSSNKKISVQVRIYLLGDTPADVEVPIIYRKVNNGNTFSIYVKNNKGYFSIGNNNTATVNTAEFAAFQWITLTGTYNGSKLKIYLDNSLISSINFSMTSGYNVTNGVTGLFIGKSDAGAFKGLIDQIEIYNDSDEPDKDSDDENSKYGYWSFTEISSDNLLVDQSRGKNNLIINDITEVVPTENLPFFVVNSASDEGDANPGDGKAVSSNGQITLRSAIEEANLLPGQHLVYFYISGTPPLIQPLTALPAIIQPVFLDGTTQSGYSGTPLVQINGAYGGITLSGGGSKIEGLSVNNSSGFGLTITNTVGNNISNNQLSGIVINSSNNNITNNIITNSISDGVSVTTGAGNNILSGNNISGNSGNGVSMVSANGNSITNNTISSNNLNGISESSSTGIITGNIITGNSGIGLLLTSSSGNQITNNTIASNNGGGISLINTSETLDGNKITGNLTFGISLNASNNTLSNNLISGNFSNGIIINGSNNKADNDSVFNNGTSGTGAGILVETGNGNSILNNSIFGNSNLGIELNTSTNDSQTSPTLNTLYTWQDVTALPNIKGGTAIQGTLNSTASENYKIQFFANASSNNGEGKHYIGETVATTDISGQSNFLANLKDAVLADGETVSATATKLDNNSNPLSTSEFSESISRSTDDGLHYKVNTTLAGIPLHWKDGKSSYQIAQSIVDLSYDSDVQKGFNTWNTLSQLDYTRRYSTNTEHWGGNADGVNNIVWIPTSTEWVDTTGAPTNVTALTRIRYNALNGEITDADIAFNGQPISLTGFGQFYWADDGDTSKLDVQNVATHEIGHYSGLADLYNPGDINYTYDLKNNNQGATMYGRIDVGETYKRNIHPLNYTNQLDVTNYDIGGINYIYSHLGSVNYDIVRWFDRFYL